MTTDEIKNLVVDDLYAAAMCSARGCRLLSTALNGARTLFTFADSKGEASAAVLGYINDEAIGARSYVSAHRELRSIVYATRRTK